MADTIRTLTEALALAPDNTVGAITAQDLRDMLVSLAPAVGEVRLATPASTTIAGAGTYAEAAGTGEDALAGRGLAWSSGLRLALTSDADRLVLVVCSGTLTCGTTSAVGLTLRKNGADISVAPVRLTVGSAPANFAICAVVEMADGDYISPFVTNYDSTSSVTVASCRVSGMGVIS